MWWSAASSAGPSSIWLRFMLQWDRTRTMRRCLRGLCKGNSWERCCLLPLTPRLAFTPLRLQVQLYINMFDGFELRESTAGTTPFMSKGAMHTECSRHVAQDCTRLHRSTAPYASIIEILWICCTVPR